MKNSRQNILNRIQTASHQVTPDAGLFPDVSFREAFKSIEYSEMLNVFIHEAETVAAKVIVVKNDAEFSNALREFLIQQDLKLYVGDAEIIESLKQLNVELFPLPEDINEVQAAITSSECMIARTGSLILSAASGKGRILNVFPPYHLVIADAANLVEFPEDGIEFIQNKYKNDLPSQISFVTGPSRTADIEKTLVMGAHGPKELIIFVKNYNNAE